MMTTARPSTDDESIDFPTEYLPVFLTARELVQVEADPYLTCRDLAEPVEETIPTHTCPSCGRDAVGPRGPCPDCHLEQRGGR